MTEFELRFNLPGPTSPQDQTTTFYWPVSGRGSFNTSLGPRLGALGPVPSLNIDLVRIAVMVFAADRSVPRAIGRKVNWTSRDLGITVPVSDPDTWTAHAEALTGLLNFLSGDSWSLRFRSARPPAEAISEPLFSNIKRAVLLSGGADSAVGGYLARTQPEEHVLVSHIGATSISPVQQAAAARILTLAPDGSTQHHQQTLFTRNQIQPGGFKFRNESSQRTRSLLFLALGLASASLTGAPLWIPENGFASLNPPLGADQFGALSTRTTHPWVLTELTRIGDLVGAHTEISNPFVDRTKGEMFRWLADHVGAEEASQFLSATNSCGFTARRWLRIPSYKHCGSCFGCLVRRASFLAADLEDRSTYVIDNPPSDAVRDQLTKGSILPSIRGFVGRGIGVGDIAAMRLPEGYSASAAKDLCERGKAELELLL